MHPLGTIKNLKGMTRNEPSFETKPVILSFRFLGTSLIGSLTVSLVCTFAPLSAQIGVLGTCVSILAGLFLSYVEQEEQRENRRAELLEDLQIPLALSRDRELFDHYGSLTKSMLELAKHADPVLRE